MVLKNEDGGQDPYYYLGHSAPNDHPPVNSWTSFIVVIVLESPNEWQANLEPMSPCLFIFNGCGLSGAEKWGWWPRSLLSRPLSFKWPPTSQFLDFFHGSVIALESPNEWQANLEPMSPCLFIFNGCGLSGAEKWGWWPRSLLSRPLSFKWPPTSQFLDFFHGSVIALESPNEWQVNLEPMSPCLFIFNGCGLSGAEKWGWWPRSLLLSRPLSFKWPPTSQFLDFFNGLSLLWNLPMNDKPI